MRRIVLVVLLAACAVPSAAGAQSLYGLTPIGCWENLTGGDCGPNTTFGLFRTLDVVVSPDGRNVYTVSLGAGSVLTFNRSTGNGALTPAGCIQDTSGSTCPVKTPGLAGARRVAISADGRSVYATGFVSDAIVRFDRDLQTGVLTPAGCIQNTGGSDCGATTPGMDQPEEVEVSRDGRSVYVATSGSDAIVRFNRNLQTGALTSAGCIQNTGGVDCGGGNTTAGLNGATGVSASADDKSVYVASLANTLVRFDRDPQTGALTAVDCIENTGGATCATTTPGLFGLSGVTVSPDDANVYVLGVLGHTITTFDRSTLTGALTPAGCLQWTGGGDCGSNTSPGLNAPQGLAISPDGASAYVSTYYGNGLTSLARNLQTGGLSFAGCLQNTGGTDCGPGNTTPGLNQGEAVAVSPDGDNVYAVTFEPGTIVEFARELPPACDDTVASGAPDTAQTVAFPCRDPNADPMTIAIVGGPAHGALGGVDEGARTVGYTPNAGFSGIDSFTYRATSDGKSTRVATATILVQGAAGPAGEPGTAGPQGLLGLPGLPGLQGPAGKDSPLVAIFASAKYSARVGKKVAFAYAATAPGTTTLTIKKGKKAIARLKATLKKAGRATIRWNGLMAKRKRPAPGRYALTLTHTAGGLTATDKATLTLRR